MFSSSSRVRLLNSKVFISCHTYYNTKDPPATVAHVPYSPALLYCDPSYWEISNHITGEKNSSTLTEPSTKDADTITVDIQGAVHSSSKILQDSDAM